MNPIFKNVINYSASTHTAEEAAKQLGCHVSQIAKSIVFRGSISDAPYLIIASGINRIDVTKVSNLVGEPVEKSNAQFCKEKTGFAIGGIPPYGHIAKIKTLFDIDLLQYDVIWAAAGTATSVFKTTPKDIVEASSAICADIALRVK